MTAAADAVVVARVVSVESGPPLSVDPPPPPGVGGHTLPAGTETDPLQQRFSPIPTQRVTFEVEQSVLGELAGEVTIFKLGATGAEPAGDPAYASGSRHLLFVRRRLDDALEMPHPDGTYIVVSPSGRYEARPGGLVGAVDDAVSAEFVGLSVSAARSVIEEHADAAG